MGRGLYHCASGHNYIGHSILNKSEDENLKNLHPRVQKNLLKKCICVKIVFLLSQIQTTVFLTWMICSIQGFYDDRFQFKLLFHKNIFFCRMFNSFSGLSYKIFYSNNYSSLLSMIFKENDDEILPVHYYEELATCCWSKCRLENSRENANHGKHVINIIWNWLTN